MFLEMEKSLWRSSNLYKQATKTSGIVINKKKLRKLSHGPGTPVKRYFLWKESSLFSAMPNPDHRFIILDYTV